MVDAALGPCEHFGDTAKVDKTAQRLFAGDLQDEVIRLVFGQCVIENIAGERGLPPGFASLRQVAFDQTGDRGGGAEGLFHHCVAR